MPSWAWFIAGIFAGANAGMLIYAWLCFPAYRDAEDRELQLRQENQRLTNLLAEITDSKEAV